MAKAKYTYTGPHYEKGLFLHGQMYKPKQMSQKEIESLISTHPETKKWFSLKTVSVTSDQT